MSSCAKAVLLADVGGTNTRVAVVRDGVIADVQHHENDAFPHLYDLLGACVAQCDVGHITACSIAMAGPVRGGEGVLTNRAWRISTAELRQLFDGADTVLINDLMALGLSVPSLPGSSLAVLDRPKGAVPNGQSLVVGIGTGFNLCPVLRGANGRPRCLEVEMGHAALPTPLAEHLVAYVGAGAAQFETLEHLFSGAGLARFHHLRSGADKTAKGVVQSHEAGEQAASETLMLYAGLLGLLCRELAYQYMPMDGIYFAGSVARGVLQHRFPLARDGGIGEGGKLGNLISRVPKAIILDDAAALRGCYAALEG